MTSSYLIACISSALNHLDRWEKTRAVLQLKIELRNVKLQLVICFRKSGDDLPPRFSGIEDAIARILLQSIPTAYGDALPEVRGFAKQLADDCYTSPLAVSDVVEMADSILENVTDFWVLVEGFRWEQELTLLKVDIIDAFVAQLTFLKDLLVLATGTGVQLQMIHFQPFAINAARVFINIFDGNSDADTWHRWCEEFHSKCSAVIDIATAPQVYEAYTQALSTSTFSSAAAGIFLDSFISLLWQVLRFHSNSRVKDLLKVLYERLRFCRSILKRDGKIRDEIGVMICGAGMLVCSFHHTYVEISYPDRLSELLERLGLLLAQYASDTYHDELDSGDSAYVLEDIMISDGNEETVISSHPPQVAGFQDDEVTSVLDRLTRGSKQLQIVPICGMAGVGKTTFALALYNHRSINYHFQARAWCTVSQLLDKKKVLLQLLNQLISESRSFSEMSEDDLANKLRQSLKGKRYLIVLDDVWTAEAWHSLAASFPDDSTHSRIIFTSRHLDVVPDQQPHLLRLRTDKESLEILKIKLSHKEGWSSEFGLTIAKVCKGVPLTAVIVAGFLGNTKQQGWKGILDRLSSSGVSGEKQCNSALELSFKHLPDGLKLCLLYFAAFPEDEEISVKRLLRLWTGEGFVKESEFKSIEDVAREYMENLIRRSLVMVAQNRSIGGVKTCRIHDLIRDFCLRKSKQENFFHLASEREDELTDFNEPPNLQRLSIHSDFNFKEARLFCPRAHSMLFFCKGTHLFDMAFIVQIYKFLTVLDIHAIWFTAGIPSEIELLTQLRYLSTRGNLSVIPSSLCNLPNLQTFIGEFYYYNFISVSHSFWNLHKLKWLYIRCPMFHHGFTLPAENIEKSSPLLELETLCGVVFNSRSSMEQQMRKFPNIRRMKCRILSEFLNKIVVPDFLNKVQCLSISGTGPLQCEFGLSENLRRLSLDSFKLLKEEIADIGKLPKLEVLKLLGIGFEGDTLDMEEGEFSKLRYLKLVDMDLKRWTVSDEQLPCLNKLILHSCHGLEQLPYDCLSYSATLEEIQVRRCCPSVEDFARQIGEAQEDYGNSVTIHITDSFPEAAIR